MPRLIWPMLAVMAVASAAACTSLKPYEKEFLLHPTMADDTVEALRPALMGASTGNLERLGAGGPGAGGATSCPTCGG